MLKISKNFKTFETCHLLDVKCFRRIEEKGNSPEVRSELEKMMTYILDIDEEPSKHHGNIEFVAG